MLRIIISFFIIFPCLTAVASNSEGTITGFVFEATTNSSLSGAHLQILELERGTVSKNDGSFQFENVPTGIYTLKVSFVGFQTRVLTDVVVSANRVRMIDIQLQVMTMKGEEVKITSDYFYLNESQPTSHISINSEEIRRSPGSGQELSRVIMSTPGVASRGDISQDLMVRGGNPRENGYYIDQIFIPGIQHFEEMDGSSNGPIGVINTDLVEHIDFYAGGFSASYGGRMSSMTDIRYRNIANDRTQGSINMNMAGFGGSVESPIGEGRARWLISARRSYLDLLSNAIGSGGAPRYGDIQAKATFDIDKANKLTLLQIYGDSQFAHSIEDARESGYLSNPTYKNNQNTTGLNWRRFWSDNLFSNTSFSYSFTNQNLLTQFVDDNTTEMDYSNHHDYLNIRNVTYWRSSDTFSFEFGTDLNFTKGNFNYVYAPFINETGISRPEFKRNLAKKQFTGELFGTTSYKPIETININVGGRLGYNNINERVTFSPRVSGNWKLTNRLTMTAATGIYRQYLPLYIRSQQSHFDGLKDPYALHMIGGFDYLLGDATKFSLEFYEKQYNNMPIQTENFNEGLPEYVFDSMALFDDLSDHGKAYARGVDLSLQRKMKNGIYGTVSLSMFQSRYLDYNGEWQSRDFDVEHLVSLIGGYRPNDKWEFSARWTYIGNRPTTPVDIIQSEKLNQTILDNSLYNQDSLPAFHSMYLRLDRRFFMSRITITTFLEVWNSYNRNNVESMYWDRTNKKLEEEVYFNFLPVGGFVIKF